MSHELKMISEFILEKEIHGFTMFDVDGPVILFLLNDRYLPEINLFLRPFTWKSDIPSLKIEEKLVFCAAATDIDGCGFPEILTSSHGEHKLALYKYNGLNFALKWESDFTRSHNYYCAIGRLARPDKFDLVSGCEYGDVHIFFHNRKNQFKELKIELGCISLENYFFVNCVKCFDIDGCGHDELFYTTSLTHCKKGTRPLFQKWGESMVWLARFQHTGDGPSVSFHDILLRERHEYDNPSRYESSRVPKNAGFTRFCVGNLCGSRNGQFVLGKRGKVQIFNFEREKLHLAWTWTTPGYGENQEMKKIEALSIADVNGCGKPELVFIDPNQGELVVIAHSTGDQYVELVRFTLEMESEINLLELYDVDSCGIPEIIVAGQNAKFIRIYKVD